MTKCSHLQPELTPDGVLGDGDGSLRYVDRNSRKTITKFILSTTYPQAKALSSRLITNELLTRTWHE